MGREAQACSRVGPEESFLQATRLGSTFTLFIFPLL